MSYTSEEAIASATCALRARWARDDGDAITAGFWRDACGVFTEALMRRIELEGDPVEVKR